MLLLSIFFYGCTQQYPGKTPPKAINGFLDLSDWNFVEDGPVKLEGKWEMYQGQLLEPLDFNTNSASVKSKQYKLVPQRKSKTSLPELLTYRIKIKMKDLNKNLVFRHYFNKPGKIWINNQLVLYNGVAPEDHLSKVIPKTNYQLADKIIALPSLHGNNHHYEIIIQVAKVSYLYDFASPYIGLENQIQRKYDKNIFLYMIFASAILIMGLYHLVLFYMRSEDLSTLFFGLFCCSIFFASLVQTPPFIIYVFFPDVRAIWPFFIFDLAHSVSTILFTQCHKLNGKVYNSCNVRVCSLCGFVRISVLAL